MVTPKTSPRDTAALGAIYVANSALDVYKSPSDFVWNQSAQRAERRFAITPLVAPVNAGAVTPDWMKSAIYVGSSDVVGKAITLGSSVTPDWRIPLYSGGDIETLTRPVTGELTHYSASLVNPQKDSLFTIGSLTKLDKPYRLDASAVMIAPVSTGDSLVSGLLKSPYSVSASDKLWSFVEHHKTEHPSIHLTLAGAYVEIAEVERHKIEYPSIQRLESSIDTVSTMVETLPQRLATAIAPSILSSVEYTLDKRLNEWSEQFRNYLNPLMETVEAEITAPSGHVVKLKGGINNIREIMQDLFMGTLSKQETLQPKVPKTGKSRANDLYQRVKLSIVDWLVQAGDSQSDACLAVGINDPKTYRTYRSEGLLLGESQLGVSFERLYEMYEQNKLSQWVRSNAGKWRENSIS